MSYYDDLKTTRVIFTDDTSKDFDHSESGITGDFVVIYQKDHKSVFPLKDVKVIQTIL